MKKVIFFLFTLFLFSAYSTFSQTIVGTTPENKNVILEEFTGIHCGYCPQGHAIAQAIQDAHPNDVFLINIHTGGYATPSSGEPDFRTSFGSSIAGQSGLVGYPAGTVNRHLFPGYQQGSGTAQSRSTWSTTSNIVLNETSYVNVGVEAEINVDSREITVHVEAYYTGNSPESTNLLNVALLQDNTLGPQSGGGAGNNYVHMHRLVHMITGQWGDNINTTTSGTFIDKSYTYTIPADYRGINAIIPDLKVVAFITETHQEIASGSGCTPTYIFSGDNNAKLNTVSSDPTSCGAPISPKINFSNLGNNEITSLNIEYSINGGTAANYTWTGNINPFESVDLELPAISFALQATNTINITLADDDNNSDNTGSTTFDIAVEPSHVITLILNSGNNGSTLTWNFKDISGNIIQSGGPYSNNQTVVENFIFPPNCYEFNIMNTSGNGSGAVRLSDAEGTEFYFTNGQYGEGDRISFSTFVSAPIISNQNSYPINGDEGIPLNTEITIAFNEAVRMVNNDLITDLSFINIMPVPPTGETISFSASINNDNDVITIVPDEDLPENTFIRVTIPNSIIENFYDVEYAGSYTTFKTSSLVDISDMQSKIKIYPNPVNNIITISNALGSYVEIFEISGKLLFTKKITSANQQLNISNIGEGTYFIKIKNNNNTITKKIVVLK